MLRSSGKPKPTISPISGSDVHDAHLWAQYLLRWDRAEAVPFQLPPFNHLVPSMVYHPEFNDETALRLYGSFPACDVTFKRHTLDGALELCADVKLSGLTVLYLACSMFRDGTACYNLLRMDLSGLMILEDLAQRLAQHGRLFGHEMFQVVVGHLIDDMYRRTETFTMQDWGRRLSLLLASYICRYGEPMSRMTSQGVDDVLRDLWLLYLSDDAIPRQYKAAAIGFFTGNALGILVQLLSETIIGRKSRALKLKRGIAVGAETIQNTVSLGQTLLSAAAQAVPTRFSLDETKAWLHYWIDQRTTRKNREDYISVERVLDRFHEHAQMLEQNCLDTRADIGPFNVQFNQGYAMAMDADPSKTFSRNMKKPRVTVVYKLIATCPSAPGRCIDSDTWARFFAMKI